MTIKKTTIKFILTTSIILVGWFLLFEKQKAYGNKICNTKKMALKGIISGKSGHGKYFQISVDNINEIIYIDIKKTIYFKGFPRYYSYNIGDSIIKSINSNEIKIKNGVNLAIYILNCDE